MLASVASVVSAAVLLALVPTADRAGSGDDARDGSETLRAAPGPSPPAGSIGTYTWPAHGTVIRRFEPPASPYGAGHRGIDIATPAGTAIRASSGGVVAFAGLVAGSRHVSIDHPDGIRTSYSFLSTIGVRTGDTVARGTVIAASGSGHPGSPTGHLHFGARYAGEYIDPMLLLERDSLVGLVHLAPLQPREGSGHPPS
ncbi:MAG: M23 family metallopeptidase [Actinomycetota bacterium]|nr:M23 family metallopeptidase [Actinomycetota bacterium]